MRLREYGVHADNADMRMRMKISSTFIRIQDHKFTNESKCFLQIGAFYFNPLLYIWAIWVRGIENRGQKWVKNGLMRLMLINKLSTWSI